MSVTVRIRRLPHAADLPLPAYHSESASGMDLLAALPDNMTVVIEPGARDRIPTGLALEIPEGFEAQVRPRSGLAHRHGITVLNAPGTIDADYRGEVQVILINHGQAPFEVRRGTRIAQLVLAQVEQVRFVSADTLGGTARGEGGFGSTGTHGPAAGGIDGSG